MNSDYEQLAGPTIFVIYRSNMSSNIIKIYMDRLYTQINFHKVQEHLKRSLDE